MLNYRSSQVKILVWLLAVLLLIGCQTDSLNSPIMPDAGSQSPSLTQGDVGQSSTTSLIGGLLRRVLGLVTAIVTPLNGGTLTLFNSQLVIPPYAVTATTSVTWVLRSETPGGLSGALNRVYEFGPEGLSFQTPSTLYVAFADAGLGNNDPHLYTFYYFNESTQQWEPQVTGVDPANQRFVVTLHHFSRYAFGR